MDRYSTILRWLYKSSKCSLRKAKNISKKTNQRPMGDLLRENKKVFKYLTIKKGSVVFRLTEVPHKESVITTKSCDGFCNMLNFFFGWELHPVDSWINGDDLLSIVAISLNIR